MLMQLDHQVIFRDHAYECILNVSLGGEAEDKSTGCAFVEWVDDVELEKAYDEEGEQVTHLDDELLALIDWKSEWFLDKVTKQLNK